jgi:putative lipoprotein
MSTMFSTLGAPNILARLVATTGLVLAAMAYPAQAQSIEGTARLTSPGNPPIRFDIPVDLARILPNRRYAVRTRILVGDRLMFATDSSYPVLTQGHGTTVAMLLRRVGSGPLAPSGPTGSSGPPQARSARPLEKTYWKATEPVPTAEATQTGDAIKFGSLAGTMMACPNTADTERGLRKALSRASRWSIVGDRLELFDSGGSRLAQFEALEGHDR